MLSLSTSNPTVIQLNNVDLSLDNIHLYDQDAEWDELIPALLEKHISKNFNKKAIYKKLITEINAIQDLILSVPDTQNKGKCLQTMIDELISFKESAKCTIPLVLHYNYSSEESYPADSYWIPLASVANTHADFFHLISFSVIYAVIQDKYSCNYKIIKDAVISAEKQVNAAKSALAKKKQSLIGCTDTKFVEEQLAPLIKRVAGATKNYEKAEKEASLLISNKQQLLNWSNELPADYTLFKKAFEETLELFEFD